MDPRMWERSLRRWPEGDGGGGGTDGGGGDDETVARAEYDKIVAQSTKRDKLLRTAQRDLAAVSAEQAAILEALGIELPEDPDERKTALGQLSEQRRKRDEGKTLAKEEVDRLLGERDRKHKKEKDDLVVLADARLQTLRSLMIDKEAALAGAEFGATEGGQEAILLKIQSEADILEEDGELKAIIKGKDGPRLTGKGEHMTVRDRVREISEDAKYASWFRAQGRPGGGTPASTGAGAPGQGGRLRVTREQLGDGAYYKEHRDEILKAQREGRLDITG